jgi:hypothetical protein
MFEVRQLGQTANRSYSLNIYANEHCFCGPEVGVQTRNNLVYDPKSRTLNVPLMGRTRNVYLFPFKFVAWPEIKLTGVPNDKSIQI